MSVAAAELLAEFEAAANAAMRAEDALRKRMAEEVARLERDRAFAYRKFNLVRTLAHAVSGAETEDAAVASGVAALRTELGWVSDSEARAETLAHFQDVVRSIHGGLSAGEEDRERATRVQQALASFEAWYETAFERPFWVLFEQEIAEIPLVEP